MVKNDRSLTPVNGYILLVSAPFWAFMAWLQGSFHSSLAASMQPFYVSIVVLDLAVGVVLLRRAYRWKGINERRQMAAAWGFAARVPLAQPHPLPNVGALPLPFTITLKPTPLKFLLIFCLITIPMLAYDLLAYFPLGQVGQGFLPFIIFFTLGMWVILLFCFIPQLSSQRLEITSQGLTVRHAVLSRLGTNWPYGSRNIRWNEARLFAVRDGKPGTPAMHYELSSPYTVVQWTRTRGHRWSLHRPAIPFAEYDAQMEALIALISGVTGLPLYDVR